jgi:endoglucanase
MHRFTRASAFLTLLASASGCASRADLDPTGTPALGGTNGGLGAAGNVSSLGGAGAGGSGGASAAVSGGVPGAGGSSGSAPVASKTCESSYEAETMTPSTGEAVEQGWSIYTQGTLSASHTFKGGSAKLTVIARGVLALGAWPHMIVRVGSTKVGELDVTTDSWTHYAFDVSPVSGSQKIEVEFTNDALEGEEDRNLYVDKVRVVESCDGGSGVPGGAGNGAGGSSNPSSGSGGGSGSTVPLKANPFSGVSMYIDPELPAIAAERSLRSAGNDADADLMKKIATSPQADWIGGWSGEPAGAVRSVLSKAGDALRVLVAYNIYNRDCGGASQGGVSDANAYRSWIDGFASGIGSQRVVVILEPDTLGHECDSSRWEVLSYAVTSLKKNANTRVYIDAGHSNWVPAGTMASRLKTAGIASADGFSLNVSNFQTTSASIGFGTEVSGQVGNKPFVIDTSRNGKGPSGGEWCNPSGRGLGEKPTAETGNALVHAFLWIKRPGESDGACNGGPAAGEWFQSYALELARNAVF